MELSQLFKLLSDSTRLKAVLLLHHFGELCVCDLVAAMDESQPKISRHLAQLRTAGMLDTRRAGQWIYYRINHHQNTELTPLLDYALRAESSLLAPMINIAEQQRCHPDKCD